MKHFKTLAIIILATLTISCESDSYNGSDSQDTGTSGSLARFAIAGNYLYTVELEQLKIFNISDETSPQFIKQIYPGFGIETIFSSGGYLFWDRAGVYTFTIFHRRKTR